MGVTAKVKSRKAVKNNPQGLTLKELQGFYQKTISPRFQEMEQRFDKVDRRVEEVNHRVDEVYDHIDGLYKLIEDLKIEYHALLGGVRRIEEYLNQDSKEKAELKKEVSVLKSQVLSLHDRVDRLETRLSNEPS